MTGFQALCCKSFLSISDTIVVLLSTFSLLPSYIRILLSISLFDRRKKPQLWLEGNRYRKKMYGNPNFIPTHKFGVYSHEIHSIPNGPYEDWKGELLYEPTVLKKNDVVSRIVHDIGAINLDDTEDVPCRLRASVRETQAQKVSFRNKKFV